MSALTSKPHITFRVVLFMVILLLPMGMMVFDIDLKVNLDENRQLAPLPKMRINRKLAKSVDRYLDDHFGGRQLLAKTALLYDRRIMEKPVINSVLYGENGWFYYAKSNIEKKYIGAGRLSGEELASMRQTILGQYRFCRDRGIHYLFVVAPDKNTIYPEHLPDWLRGRCGVTPLQQLKAEMRSYPEIAILDLSEVMLNKKRNGLLYWKSDTHWTQLGAYYGYWGIVSELSAGFSAIQPMAIDAFQIDVVSRKGGDLAIMVGEEQHVLEKRLMFTPKNGWRAKRVTPDRFYQEHYALRPQDDDRLIVMQKEDHQLPRAVMFRDSFAVSLRPFLAEHFQRFVIHWRFFDEDMVSREKPDIVIVQAVERSLSEIFPQAGDS